ncbi:GvpL/GvpF family gas vesicle protein [Nocardioides sp. YIM 152315]|uniref:GvpL/GvpF family gas vesicle protein n=1 Tax=Nocardioides sp. YIM 152315 TaxID=3031760 RepID=UPI0023DB1C1C|nr:GvpL/GvpF family gas vesicle protein [Nocardioides sp. YIM 152315]MDF1602513.1 GvpL/GvpF family gas vesicle protein [Nocardioides sp. YIM 152315]
MTAPQPPVGVSADTGRYLYAVCRGLDAAAVDSVQGIDGATLELVDHRDLVALVSTVPLSSYGEEALRRNLEDLSWLETVVRAHDTVIHAAARHAPTAPLRLATVCFDDAAVRDRLREWYVALTDVLDRVDGCSEWSVKVLVPTEAPEPSETAAPTSGADYLRRKKSDAARRAGTAEAATATAHLVHDSLASHARDSRQLPPQDPRLSGHEGTMVLNAAYLVPDDAAEAFAGLVAGLGAEHPDVVVDGRGPWPPYSFAMLEQR